MAATWLALLAGLAVGAAQLPGGMASRDARIFEIPGYVGDWDTESDTWFAMQGYNLRFSIPQNADRGGFWQLLEAAAERGVALRLRFDAAAGRLVDNGLLLYPLCAVGAANGAWHGDATQNCPPETAVASRAEQLLALGVAQSFEHPETARQTLAEALRAAPALPANGQALALITRAEAAEAISADLELADPAYDRLWADALSDYRRVVALMPDRATARSATASALIALGGYEEALEVYREIGRRWPEQAFQTAVNIGTLYRQQGDYPRALATLDDYARTGDAESMDGMRFRYHRAWTLILLRRDEEALREIETGLRTQPDYAAAYQLRSCARARLGRPAEALEDQRRAMELTAAYFSTPSAATRADLARSRAVIALLEQAVAARRSSPTAAPCESFWDRWSRPRGRSPLLDAAARPA
jgi:tetratricopeptide (TPR) repeat protein